MFSSIRWHNIVSRACFIGWNNAINGGATLYVLYRWRCVMIKNVTMCVVDRCRRESLGRTESRATDSQKTIHIDRHRHRMVINYSRIYRRIVFIIMLFTVAMGSDTRTEPRVIIAGVGDGNMQNWQVQWICDSLAVMADRSSSCDKCSEALAWQRHFRISVIYCPVGVNQ